MKASIALLALLMACCPWQRAAAIDPPGGTSAEIDAAALKAFQSVRGTPGSILIHLDLGKAFETRVQWSLVAVQGPTTHDPPPFDEDLSGPIVFCLVRELTPDCAGPAFPPNHTVLPIVPWDKNADQFRSAQAEILLAGNKIRQPLLLLTAGSLRSGDGDQLLSTFVLTYDKKTDQFVGLFANGTGRNNNQRTRFIGKGPLTGDIVVDEPTPNAPFAYFVTVYRRSPSGPYVELLRYRSRTRYGDGNPLAVIDSEMPEILRRLHFWKTDDPLPVPMQLPAGCTLAMHNGTEICR
jgi:hypothetical protein